MREFVEACKRHHLEIAERVPLAHYTTLRVGGVARYLLRPKGFHEVVLAIELAHKFNLPVFFLGGGSNLLVRDGGFPGVMVSLRGLTKLRYLGDGLLEAEAGVPVGALLHLSLKEELSGLEFLAGVPATVGGLVAMNAGAFGQEVKDFLREVVVWHQGEIQIWPAERLDFAYRSWGGPKDALILKVLWALRPCSRAEVEKRLRFCLETRKRTQPVGEATAGCVFKNPAGIAAGFLLEKVGLKGFVRGRAAFSRKHANFIVTREGARAADVLALIDKAKEEVWRAFGLKLTEEVVIVGEA